MKKFLGIIFLVLLVSGNANAKTVKALIENVSIDDVKSKLIDIHLNQDYEIGEETSNKITFIKKRKGMLKSNVPHPCDKPWQQIAIEHDGEVVLCSLDYKHQVKIGNINDNTIEEIWNNEMMRKYRDGQNNKEKLCNLDLCKDCIRGGRYVFDEHKLTKLITANPSNFVSKVAYKAYLYALDII